MPHYWWLWRLWLYFELDKSTIALTSETTYGPIVFMVNSHITYYIAIHFNLRYTYVVKLKILVNF